MFSGIFEHHVSAQRITDDGDSVSNERGWQAVKSIVQITASTGMVLRGTEGPALTGTPKVELQNGIAEIQEMG
jgi:hypothetical protein